MKIHLLHTNDVHSHLDEYLRLATQMRLVRDNLLARDEIVFLFDIGDHADRMSPETDATMGRVNAALLNSMNYDAWVFGNNEGLIIPRQHWKELCEESGAPVLTGNLRDSATGNRLPFFQDTLLIERGGVKVGMFGLTAPYNEYYNLEGIQALDPVAQIPLLVQELQNLGAEVIIFLSHLGLSVDRNLAEKITGVDVILGSHTHHVLEQPERAGNLWIAQAGKFANYFGHLVIDFDKAEGRVRNVSGRVVARDDMVDVDTDLHNLMETWQKRADQVMDRVLMQVPESLGHHFHEESELGNLVADEMRQLADAEIALLNTGVFLFGLEAGPLTRRMLLACCPSPINPVLIELYGWQIRDVLKKARVPEYTHRRGMGFGFRGKEIGSLAISGMQVSYDPDHESVQVEVDGEPLQDDRIYRVVTADYLVFSGVYEEVARGSKIRIVPLFLREVAERALRDPLNLDKAKEKRWIEQ